MSEQTVSDPNVQHNDRPTGWRRVPVSRVPNGEAGRVGGQVEGQVGGVVAGVSRAYGFDVRTTRIAVAIATIVLPVLALVYLAAWVLLPDRPEEAQPLEDIVRDRRRLPVILAIALVLVVGSLGSFGAWFLFRGAPWGLALIAIGALLWVSTTLGRQPGSAVADASGPGPSSGGFEQPTGAFALVADPTPTDALATAPRTTAPLTTTLDRVSPPVPAPVPPPRRRRLPIATFSLVAALVFVGIASAIEALSSWNVPALWVTVIAVLIVVIGLGISIVVNRVWLLIVPLLALVGLLTMLTIAQPHLDGGAGQRTLTPTTVAAAEQVEHLGAGELKIDLRSLPAGTDEVNVRAEVGMGRLNVIVPPDVTVLLNTELGMGVVQLDGNDIAQGARQSDSRTVDPLDPAVGEPTRTIVLDLTMGMGQIDVERAG